MERIFFYANISVDDKSSGITKKVLTQIETLRDMGYEVYFTSYTHDGVAIFDNNNHMVGQKKYSTKSSKLNRYLRRWNILKYARNFIDKSDEHFDYAYLRFHFFDRTYLKLLKALKKTRTKVIIEAHGYPYRSRKLTLLSPIYFIDFLYEPFVRKYIDLVAAISNHKNIWKCKTVQIDNAVNLKFFNLQQKKGNPKNKLTLISVSNERNHHGYPKLIRSLAEYYKNGGTKQIEINFVGESKNSTKNLANKLNLTQHINFHGKKYGDELMKLYKEADIGVGPLAPRANSVHGSSIKAKEYFALGLPFINGWKEYAFDDSYPYVLHFNPNEEIIDFNKVIEFYDTIKNDGNVSYEMRQFAKENYTWEAQFRKVFDSLK